MWQGNLLERTCRAGVCRCQDVESMLHKLLGAADGNVHQAQRGIIYIDEVDKITRSDNASMTRDVSGAAPGLLHQDGPVACTFSKAS